MPQGLALGPLLILAYVNNLPDWQDSLLNLFTDNAKAMRRSNLNNDEGEFQSQYDKWMMTSNPRHVMYVG